MPLPPEVTEYELGLAAFEWIRYALNEGDSLGKTLASSLQSRVGRNEGRVTTLLPPGQNEAALHEYSAGNKLPVTGEPKKFGSGSVAIPIPNMDLALEQIAHDFLHQDPQHIFLVQESLGLAEDPWVELHDSPLILVENEIYYFATANRLQAMKHCVQAAHAIYPPGLALLTEMPAGSAELEPRAHLRKEAIEELSRRAQTVVIGAYDGEGFLLWQPPLYQAS